MAIVRIRSVTLTMGAADQMNNVAQKQVGLIEYFVTFDRGVNRCIRWSTRPCVHAVRPRNWFDQIDC